MSNSTSILPEPSAVESKERDDLFGDLPPIKSCDLKKNDVAIQLTALMAFSKTNRSTLAEKLKWKKSRMTQVLSGKGNPTVNTVFEFCNALGYEFDLIFRLSTERRAAQPWQKARSYPTLLPAKQVTSQPLFRLIAQTADQVEEDMRKGKRKPIYISAYLPQRREAQKMISTDSENGEQLASSGGLWIRSLTEGSQRSLSPTQLSRSTFNIYEPSKIEHNRKLRKSSTI